MIRLKISKIRVISVTTAVVLLLISILSLVNSDAFTSSGVSNEIRYQVYNANTGKYLRFYYLTVEPNDNISTHTVIGNDERVLDWTKSGVVEIDSFGTGFVVDEHTIATAAHCIYGKTINTIYLFANNNNKPTLTLKDSSIVEYHIPSAYVNCVNSGISGIIESSDYDYALITVKEDLSDYMCFNLGTVTDIKNLKSAVSITGFPLKVGTGNDEKPVNDSGQHNMYTGNGRIFQSDDKRLYYNIDTTSGNSGGPVYVTEVYENKVYYTVIAIHTLNKVGDYNSGTRMTVDLLKFFNGNTNLRY